MIQLIKNIVDEERRCVECTFVALGFRCLDKKKQFINRRNCFRPERGERDIQKSELMCIALQRVAMPDSTAYEMQGISRDQAPIGCADRKYSTIEHAVDLIEERPYFACRPCVIRSV